MRGLCDVRWQLLIEVRHPTRFHRSTDEWTFCYGIHFRFRAALEPCMFRIQNTLVFCGTAAEIGRRSRPCEVRWELLIKVLHPTDLPRCVPWMLLLSSYLLLSSLELSDAKVCEP